MRNSFMVRSTGVLCIVGGLLFFLDFTLVGWLMKNGYFAVLGAQAALLRTLLWCLVSVLLGAGSAGLLTAGATGDGWRRKLSYLGIALILLGAASYMAGSIYIYSFPERGTRQFFTPAGSLLITLGMIGIAVAVITAKVWRGWRRFVPAPVALYFPLQLPLQVFFFLGAGKGPNPVLLGAWGLSWMLLGLAIWSSVPAPLSGESAA